MKVEPINTKITALGRAGIPSPLGGKESSGRITFTEDVAARFLGSFFGRTQTAQVQIDGTIPDGASARHGDFGSAAPCRRDRPALA